MRINLFAQQGFYTEIHNALLDVVLPAIPPNAWKVLCVIVRQTKGWQRTVVGLSVPQIMELTGINSAHTIQKALQDLRSFQQNAKPIPLLIEQQENRWLPRVWALNRKAQIDWLPNALSASEPDALSASEPDALSASEPDALSASHVRKEETINRKKKQQQQEAKKQIAAAADPEELHSSIFSYAQVCDFVIATRPAATNPKGLARTIWRAGNDDAEIKIWLKSQATQKKSEIAKSKRAKQVEMEMQAAFLAQQEFERERSEFLDSLPKEVFADFYNRAGKETLAKLPKNRVVKIENYRDAIMALMYKNFVEGTYQLPADIEQAALAA